jgi:hypothetical protein
MWNWRYVDTCGIGDMWIEWNWRYVDTCGIGGMWIHVELEVCGYMWNFYFQALTAFICRCYYQNTFIHLR